MSRFFSKKFQKLKPYTPGEQPRDQKYIKLNTNESPYPPSEKAVEAAGKAAKMLMLYPDPDCRELNRALADRLGVAENEILVTNGSDDILNFAFSAFCDEDTPAVFPDITYGFYSVFADLNRIPYRTIPLQQDFTIDPEAYDRAEGTIFIANPNAPTGIALTLEEIERIVKNNPDHVVVIDEAYVDFGAESAVRLIHKYDNLLVTQTFSKSRSMAGARLGFGVGCASLINDLNTLKYSTNPYSINRMTLAAGIGTLEEEAYVQENCQKIMQARAFTADQLKGLGFELTDSSANFVFAKHPKIDGEKIYTRLKEKGVLVRHFCGERIREYNRITIGSMEQMEILVCKIKEILAEELS